MKKLFQQIFFIGIRYDHCEFGGKANSTKYMYTDHHVCVGRGRAQYPGYDPIDNYIDTNLEGRDCHGHGTHVASLAVGNVSVVYSVRVLDCNGRGPYGVIIDGLNYMQPVGFGTQTEQELSQCH